MAAWLNIMIRNKHVVLCGFHWSGCKAMDLLLEQGASVEVFTHESPSHVPDLFAYAKRKAVKVTTETISLDCLECRPDLICSIYYRNKIPFDVIKNSTHGGINLHPSLLPEYRGCSSLTWAMVNGEDFAGYTYHYLDDRFDNGNILIQELYPIEPFDLQSTLYQRTMFRAMNRFLDAVTLALSGDEGRAQVGNVSYYKRGAPYGGVIDPSWSVDMVERFIRAMTNPPYPPAEYEGEPVHDLATYLRLTEVGK